MKFPESPDLVFQKLSQANSPAYLRAAPTVQTELDLSPEYNVL